MLDLVFTPTIGSLESLWNLFVRVVGVWGGAYFRETHSTCPNMGLTGGEKQACRVEVGMKESACGKGGWDGLGFFF